ncbi:DUF2267 domain-containing protein [Streptomyces flavidovirens]|uniref:DUF2267 domain-containing protein n=1 Tax=Streptomyces flavidovirens TaxID=67298 RepID=UPI003F554EC8
MRHDEFLARVRERGEYAKQEEAAQVTRAVLDVLAHRITPGEVKDLAAPLPAGFPPATPFCSGSPT